MLMPFHLAIPVKNLEESRKFYSDLLQLEEGRSSDSWIDYNFYGHQLVIHLKPEYFDSLQNNLSNLVDGHGVPVPHFGMVLEWSDWENLAGKLDGYVDFKIKPYIRFQGQVGEQGTFFFLDPSGNALEFKAFKNLDTLFAK
jgi:extradiol dioxygenase family protein